MTETTSHSMIKFWRKSIILPKKISMTADCKCKEFLWKGKDGDARLQLDQATICLPDKEGGLDAK